MELLERSGGHYKDLALACYLAYGRTLLTVGVILNDI